MKNIYPFALILILFIGNSFKSFSQCTTPTTTDGSRCGEGSVTVSAASLTGNYRWYDVASGGDIHGNSSSYNTPIISSNTTFYVSEFNNGTTNDALTFDGTNDYVAINDMHFQTQSLELITIEAWVKTTISGEGQWDNWSIVDFDRSEYFNMYVRGDNGYVGFSTTDNDSHTDDFNGTTAVNDGIWHHIVAVYDGTDKRIYVDGVLDATKVNPHGGLDLGTGITRYGYLGDGSESSSYNSSRNDFYYDGSIDEVRVWNTVRTATEITNNKDKCVPEGDEDLMLYYRMDGSGSDNTLIDYSGNNYNGKLYNMTLPGAWTTGGNLTDCPTCESSRATVVAEIKAAPVVDLGADKCINGVSVILDAGNAGTIDSYLWSEGAATTQTISVNSNGYYSVTVGHSTNSCETIDGVSVSLLSQPSGTDNDRCGDGEVDLEVNTPTSTEYNWYAASSGGNAIGTGVDFTSPSIAATTSYWVSQIDNSQYKEALHFDGVNDKVALDGFTYAGDSYTEMTVEAWIRTSDATDQIIASFDRSEYWRFEVNGTGAGSGQIGFDIFTNAGQLDFGGTTVISDGSWHHVAAVYDNGTVKIYIDGHLDATTTKGTAFGKGVGTVRYGYIGVGSEASSFNGSTAPNDYFNGAIDEVRIWNVARNITQIQNNMNNCLLGSETGLVSYYKMEDGSGSASLGDHTNNGNLGTLVNMDVNNAWINTGKNIECSCGESDREEVIATINAIPTVDFGLDRCEAATITLDA
ncbi:MAG: LamG domain-containing protein, partial [Chlamydiia bacterium]|nr:LamG domain-containing protein [Chlamydiia bacterium]